ncbi:MAG: trehalase family glycosidase [Agriterribacter sp.]
MAKHFPFNLSLVIATIFLSQHLTAQQVVIKNDNKEKKLYIGNGKLSLELDYNRKINISSFSVNGQQVVNSPQGIYSAIKTKDATYSTLLLNDLPKVEIKKDSIIISEINYGEKDLKISEEWIFIVSKRDIALCVKRYLSKEILAEKASFPAVMFDRMDVWDGAFLDYGGLAWFYLFNKKADTYGVHSRSSKFWNKKTGNGLAISLASPDNKNIAMSYSRTEKNQLAFDITLSDHQIIPRMDSGTNRRRFLKDTITDVWIPIKIAKGKTTQQINFSYFNYNNDYDRGTLVGINKGQVSDVLNTIARIGIIDKYHFGGNSWHTPYGPICLHEQYIAQLGVGINDENYLSGYQECLDYYRDNAIKENGRVFARWAYTNEDAMPGAFTDKGFYEAQWGYLMDSNPDLVINVAELYDQTGDIKWVQTHQQSCEKVLDWILQRDSNENGLVEMMTDSMEQRKGSDWIDIIWASYENAFVNAKLYHSLTLWSSIELQLGNKKKADNYAEAAQKLKTSFNKSVSQGGFWDEDNGCYIHWKDKNGSLHGRNMVTPVNFMAIAYGICDDEKRTKIILDGIEVQMQKEHLFFWPLCMTSYAKGEGNDWQFPFPNYENGDIFLSWGAVGVKAYATYKPELALKYIKNVLAQYEKDGLAFQRYGRKTQTGLGDDILSGNCLSVIGLYKSIYGINPRFNRLYIDPHISGELSGTKLKYNFRGQVISISLETNKYTASNNRFSISANSDFGFFNIGNTLTYFHGNSDTAGLQVTESGLGQLSISIKEWEGSKRAWITSVQNQSSHNISFVVSKLRPNVLYSICKGNMLLKQVKTNRNGTLSFTSSISSNPSEFSVSIK